MMQGEFPIGKIFRELASDDLLPAILFRTSRRQCDFDVERMADNQKVQLHQRDQEIILDEIDATIARYGIDEQVIRKHPQFHSLVRTGVGAHHAGQLLVWRLLLEELMSRGLLRILVATGTVAAGVDFPARTVVITAHSKRGTEGFNVLTSSEFQQMSGRAGRRGKDTIGICVIAPSQYSDARVIHEVASRPPEPLKSAYYASPSTVLNLLKYRSVDDLRYTVERSLGSFLDRKEANKMREEAEQLELSCERDQNMGDPKRKKLEKKARRLRRDADKYEGRQRQLLDISLSGLHKLGYVTDNGLTEKGLWAAELCTTLVLELGEAINDYLFSDLTMEQLVGMVGAISGDSYRTYFSLKRNPIEKERLNALATVVERVNTSYQGSPFASEISVMSSAAVTVLTWLESESWGEFSALLRLAGVAEGDAARLIGQTADHLHQLSRLTESHPELARTAEEGRRMLLRPPVTDTYEVGLAPENVT